MLKRFKEYLEYIPETGKFYWVKRPNSQNDAGEEAGTIKTNGYMQICFKRKKYYAHRLAWYFVNGNWPSTELDHINRDKLDNRIENLRQVTRSQNLHNKNLNPKNTSGYNGVRYKKERGKFVAEIKVRGVYHYLGIYENIEEAITARKNAELFFKTT